MYQKDKYQDLHPQYYWDYSLFAAALIESSTGKG